MKNSSFDLAAKATVRNLTSRSQGVLVGSGYILTAASAIKSTEGVRPSPVLDTQKIRTACGARYEATLLAYEFKWELALLSLYPDLQCKAEIHEAFEELQLDANPIPLFRGDLSKERPLPVWIRSHENEWIPAKAFQYMDFPPVVQILAEDELEFKTSGGPFVTKDGELVGVVPPRNCADGRNEWLTVRPQFGLLGCIVELVFNQHPNDRQ